MGFWLWFGSLAVWAVIARWIHRWQKDIDAYYENEDREFTDPPIFDAGGFLGGDRGF
jgi:hypothetical protein